MRFMSGTLRLLRGVFVWPTMSLSPGLFFNRLPSSLPGKTKTSRPEEGGEYLREASNATLISVILTVFCQRRFPSECARACGSFHHSITFPILEACRGWVGLSKSGPRAAQVHPFLANDSHFLPAATKAQAKRESDCAIPLRRWLVDSLALGFS